MILYPQSVHWTLWAAVV